MIQINENKMSYICNPINNASFSPHEIFWVGSLLYLSKEIFFWKICPKRGKNQKPKLNLVIKSQTQMTTMTKNFLSQLNSTMASFNSFHLSTQ